MLRTRITNCQSIFAQIYDDIRIPASEKSPPLPFPSTRPPFFQNNQEADLEQVYNNNGAGICQNMLKLTENF